MYYEVELFCLIEVDGKLARDCEARCIIVFN